MTENDFIALKLTEFIKFYQPGIWVGPIHDFAHYPYVLARDISQLRENNFIFGDYRNKVYEPWYIREAITKFFEQKLDLKNIKIFAEMKKFES
jgi:hypothetical protein